MLGAAEIAALAIACAPSVDVGTVQAIVHQESAGNPNAIGTLRARLSHQPQSRDHALHVADVLQRAGIEFDVGIAQIRTTNLRRFGISIAQALEPCTNMQLMQHLLMDAYARAVKTGLTPGAKASLAALSAYNTGNFTAGFKNGYVNKIVDAHPSQGVK